MAHGRQRLHNEAVSGMRDTWMLCPLAGGEHKMPGRTEVFHIIALTISDKYNMLVR